MSNENEATRKGASEQDETVRMTPHAFAVEAIAERMESAEPDDEEDSEESEELEDIDSTESEDEPEPQAEEKPKAETYRVKVDGEELDVPLEEIIRSYQKDRTASRRLEEAALISRQLQEEKAKLQGQWAELEQAKQAVHKVPPIPTDVEEAKTVYQALMLGDEQEGLHAIEKLLAGRAAPAQRDDSIQAEQIAQAATTEAIRRIEFSTARQRFAEDYPDVASDPDLYQLAMNALQQTAAESSSYDEAFRKAGDITRDWFKQRADRFGLVEKPAEGADSMAAKEARKQRTDHLSSTNSRSPAPKIERDPTPSEIVDEIRKSRGLSPLYAKG